MTDDYHEFGIEVDYSKSVLEVMVAAPNYHVQRNRTLDFACRQHLDISQILDEPQSNRRAAPTCLPHWWSNREQSGFEIGYDFADMMHTKCSPNSVPFATMQLKLKDPKLDVIQKCLDFDSDLETTTIRNLRTSSLRAHIQDAAGPGFKGLPQRSLRCTQQRLLRQTTSRAPRSREHSTRSPRSINNRTTR